MELLVTSNESWSRVGMTFSIMRMCRRTAPPRDHKNKRSGVGILSRRQVHIATYKSLHYLGSIAHRGDRPARICVSTGYVLAR